jgi:hypothetical protein
MKLLVSISTILFCHIATGQTLLQKAFTLGEAKYFSAKSCEVLPECDCCSADLILLTSSTFAIVDRCVGGDTFYTGTYAVKNSNLELLFKQQVVNEEENEETNTTTQKLRPYKLEDQIFKIESCDKAVVLHNYATFYTYGVGMDLIQENVLRQELAKSVAFKTLTK